jgi:hypothetical protein
MLNGKENGGTEGLEEMGLPGSILLIPQLNTALTPRQFKSSRTTVKITVFAGEML